MEFHCTVNISHIKWSSSQKTTLNIIHVYSLYSKSVLIARRKYNIIARRKYNIIARRKYNIIARRKYNIIARRKYNILFGCQGYKINGLQSGLIILSIGFNWGTLYTLTPFPRYCYFHTIYIQCKMSLCLIGILVKVMLMPKFNSTFYRVRSNHQKHNLLLHQISNI